MKLLIDIAHPAHIHYFRNLSRQLSLKGHQCLFTIREKGIIKELADYYGIEYRIRSKERRNKLVYSIEALWNIYKVATKIKPDLFLDMGTVFASPIAFIMKKPYIAFDDTEASIKARRFHMPFTNHILTPSCFYADLGKKQIIFNSYMELFYLHPKYFSPCEDILRKHDLLKNKYVLMRFVSWEAHHDVGQAGISETKKKEMVKYFKTKNMKIIISSETSLPDELDQYKIRVEPFHFHHVIAGATIVITEGATIASEAALLGTPAIYVNSIQNGYTISLAKKGLLISLKDDSSLVEHINKIIERNTSRCKKQYREKAKEYVDSKINPTEFTIWFLENYPESVKNMKENPDYDNRFL